MCIQQLNTFIHVSGAGRRTETFLGSVRSVSRRDSNHFGCGHVGAFRASQGELLAFCVAVARALGSTAMQLINKERTRTLELKRRRFYVRERKIKLLERRKVKPYTLIHIIFRTEVYYNTLQNFLLIFSSTLATSSFSSPSSLPSPFSLFWSSSLPFINETRQEVGKREN